LTIKEHDEITEKLATTYGMRISKEVIASAFTAHPKLPLLLSRSSFRPDANVRTQRRTQNRKDRRNFIRGMVGLAVVSISALAYMNLTSGSNSQPQSTTPVVTPVVTPIVSNPSNLTANPSTPTTGNPRTTSVAQPIANASNLPLNGSMIYNDPSFGPILLIHLDNGQFVAYSSICTHAGCQVQFDPSGKDIICPCHGAVYDPYHGAQVLAGPAPYPLQNISIRYDAATGNIYLVG
jgi:thiosulfate dehydrogenase [quinone] large subunit